MISKVRKVKKMQSLQKTILATVTSAELKEAKI